MITCHSRDKRKWEDDMQKNIIQVNFVDIK